MSGRGKDSKALPPSQEVVRAKSWWRFWRNPTVMVPNHHATKPRILQEFLEPTHLFADICLAYD
jgi:hypothetical protein